MSSTPGDPRRATLRTQRLRLTWLLALPFVYLSSPSPGGLLIGALVSASGLLLRGYAAGSINKDRELATGGPYDHIRHPLYVGSFLLGFGLSLAGGRWWFPVLFACLFIGLYALTIGAEEKELGNRFEADFEAYRGKVPPFLPHLRRSGPKALSPGFRSHLYRRNREWQALLGAAMGYGILWGKMFFLG